MLQRRLTLIIRRQLSSRPVVESNHNFPKPFKVSAIKKDTSRCFVICMIIVIRHPSQSFKYLFGSTFSWRKERNINGAHVVTVRYSLCAMGPIVNLGTSQLDSQLRKRRLHYCVAVRTLVTLHIAI